MPKVCLIVPCYNEEKRLREEHFVSLLQERYDTSFCFVNDGSLDATQEILDSWRKRHQGKITVLTLAKNCGKAEAIRRGVLHVLATLKPDLLGYWDADVSTPLGELKHMLAAFEINPSCNLAMASRIRRLGSVIERRPVRHLLGRLFAMSASRVLQLPVYDTQCGAKVFRAGIAPVLFERQFLTRWLFDVEILARLRNHLGRDGLLASAMEVPLHAWHDVNGSSLRPKDLLRVPFDLLRIGLYYNRRP